LALLLFLGNEMTALENTTTKSVSGKRT